MDGTVIKLSRSSCSAIAGKHLITVRGELRMPKPTEGVYAGMNDRLRKKTKRGREKWISAGVLNSLFKYFCCRWPLRIHSPVKSCNGPNLETSCSY